MCNDGHFNWGVPYYLSLVSQLRTYLHGLHVTRKINLTVKITSEKGHMNERVDVCEFHEFWHGDFYHLLFKSQCENSVC